MNPRLSDEIWFAAKLKAAGGWNPFQGLSTPQQRAERAREAILANKLEDAIIGKRDGEPWTFGRTFAWIYQQPLKEVA